MNIYFNDFQNSLKSKWSDQNRLQVSKSEYMDKKDQLKSLQNRMILLKTEDQIQEGQIKQQQYKLQKQQEIYKFKKNLSEINVLHQKNKERLNQQIFNKAQTSRQNKIQGLQNIKLIRQQQNELNQQQIKYEQEKNEQEILKRKLIQNQKNRQKSENVKQKIREIRENVINFWDQRYTNFQMDKSECQQKYEKYTKQDSKNIQKLMREENQYMQKIQNSIDLKKNIKSIKLENNKQILNEYF